mgnify:FL=1
MLLADVGPLALREVKFELARVDLTEADEAKVAPLLVDDRLVPL